MLTECVDVMFRLVQAINLLLFLNLFLNLLSPRQSLKVLSLVTELRRSFSLQSNHPVVVCSMQYLDVCVCVVF